MMGTSKGKVKKTITRGSIRREKQPVKESLEMKSSSRRIFFHHSN